MKTKTIIKYIVLLLSVGLIIAGAATGEAQSVFSKATRICFECIGIG